MAWTPPEKPTPSTYFGEVISRIKVFIDRTFSYLLPDYITNPIPSRLSPGKKLIFIQTQAEPDESHIEEVYCRYEVFFKWQGFDNAHLIRAFGLADPGYVEENEELMTQAEGTALRYANREYMVVGNKVIKKL